jgi:hypothetical protein
MWKPTELDDRQLWIVFLAVFLGNVFYILPFIDVARSFRERVPLPSTPYFYSLSMMNTLIWCTYGFIIPDPFFLGSDMIGSIATTYYFLVALVVEGGSTGRAGSAGFIVFHTAQVAIVMLGCFYTQWISVPMEKMLGWAGNIWSIAMLWAPIIDAVEAWKTKDINRIFMPISVLTVINSSIWTAYGIWLRLNYVWMPSILTLMSGIIQIGVYGALSYNVVGGVV